MAILNSRMPVNRFRQFLRRGSLLGLVLLMFAGCTPASSRIHHLEMSEMDLEQSWSGVRVEEGVRFRTAEGKGQKTIRIPAWWNENRLRPKEGTRWVFEIHYKDTLTTPAVVLGHGGIGRYFSPTELHRIGGKADGKWKTANVPAAWGQLIRLQEEPDSTALTFRTDEPLSISTISVRPARPGDEERYNAETRAWIRQVQADKRAKLPRSEVRILNDAEGSELPAMLAYPWEVLVPLLPGVAPKTDILGGPVRIRMNLNEIEGGSFGVFANGKDLTNVEYEVSPLRGDAGTLDVDIIPRTAEYAIVPGGPSGVREFPQRLWPAFAVDIPAGRSHWFVLNLRTHRRKAQPGLYKGTITITSEQGQTRLPLEVAVLPVDLMTMNEAGLLMGGCTSGLLPVHDFDLQKAYNQNATNLWFAGVQPPMKIENEELVLDYAYLDEWMESAKKHGCEAVVWFLGGNPYGFPHTMSIFRDLARIDTRDGNEPLSVEEWVKLQASEENRNQPLPRDRELFKEWVKQVTTHARSNEWPELILTPFDEPAKWVQGPYRKAGSTFPGIIGAGPWIKPYFIDASKAIREADPKTRIYASIHHNRTEQQEGICFLPYIDVFCTNAIHEDPKLGDKVRAAGEDFWQYSGAGGGGAGIPDRARYTFGFYFAAFDSRGSLCWAYNWGRGFDTSEGNNWMYAWQTPFDTIPAPYFEGMREAWDDRRVIETYKNVFSGDVSAMKSLQTIFQEAASSRARGGRDTVSDFWAAVDDAEKLDQWRGILLERLVGVAEKTPGGIVRSVPADTSRE